MARADQISREFKVSDQGIDMEIEFNDDAHEATGAKLYLQLKKLKGSGSVLENPKAVILSEAEALRSAAEGTLTFAGGGGAERIPPTACAPQK